MKYLLDTVTVSYLDEYKSPQIAKRLLKKIRSVGERHVYTCPIVVGQMYAGIFFNPKMKEAKRQSLVKIISSANLLKMNRETGQIYGKLKVELFHKGATGIDDNDIWIASIALTHNAVLVTDDKDFNAIDGLKIENWIK